MLENLCNKSIVEFDELMEVITKLTVTSDTIRTMSTDELVVCKKGLDLLNTFEEYELCKAKEIDNINKKLDELLKEVKKGGKA